MEADGWPNRKDIRQNRFFRRGSEIYLRTLRAK